MWNVNENARIFVFLLLADNWATPEKLDRISGFSGFTRLIS